MVSRECAVHVRTTPDKYYLGCDAWRFPILGLVGSVQTVCVGWSGAQRRGILGRGIAAVAQISALATPASHPRSLQESVTQQVQNG